ncbi:hypothetical protein [Spirillospora sp. NPDC047279]|uniref:hypothetical protein n=1 Tax=Spirillospora sp. NPDC047279 TaxID=3155478 RepID=UPI003407798D
MNDGPWTGFPGYQIKDPALTAFPAARMRALQGERLAALVAHVHRRSPSWRRKPDAAGVGPADITGVADVGRLPTCDEGRARRPPAPH